MEQYMCWLTLCQAVRWYDVADVLLVTSFMNSLAHGLGSSENRFHIELRTSY